MSWTTMELVEALMLLVLAIVVWKMVENAYKGVSASFLVFAITFTLFLWKVWDIIRWTKIYHHVRKDGIGDLVPFLIHFLS